MVNIGTISYDNKGNMVTTTSEGIVTVRDSSTGSWTSYTPNQYALMNQLSSGGMTVNAGVIDQIAQGLQDQTKAILSGTEPKPFTIKAQEGTATVSPGPVTPGTSVPQEIRYISTNAGGGVLIERKTPTQDWTRETIPPEEWAKIQAQNPQAQGPKTVAFDPGAATLTRSANETILKETYVGGGNVNQTVRTESGDIITRTIYKPGDQSFPEYALKDLEETFRPKIDINSNLIEKGAGSLFGSVLFPITGTAGLSSFIIDLAKIPEPKLRGEFLTASAVAYGTNAYNYAVTDPVGFTVSMAGSMIGMKILGSTLGEIKAELFPPKPINSQGLNQVQILNQNPDGSFSAEGSAVINTPVKNAKSFADYNLLGRRSPIDQNIILELEKGSMDTLIERKILSGMSPGSNVYTKIESGFGTLGDIRPLRDPWSFGRSIQVTSQGDVLPGLSMIKKLPSGSDTVDVFKSWDISKSLLTDTTFKAQTGTIVYKGMKDLLGSGGSGSTVVSGGGGPSFAWDVGSGSGSGAASSILKMDLKTADIPSKLLELDQIHAQAVASATKSVPWDIGAGILKTDIITPPAKTDRGLNTVTINSADIFRSEEKNLPTLSKLTMDIKLDQREKEIPFQKFGPSSIERSSEGLGIVSINTQVQTQKQTEKTALKLTDVEITKQLNRPAIMIPIIRTPDVPIVFPPFSGFGNLNRSWNRQNRVSRPGPITLPSLEALDKRIFGKMPREITGLELRPIPIQYKRKRHKRK